MDWDACAGCPNELIPHFRCPALEEEIPITKKLEETVPPPPSMPPSLPSVIIYE